MSRGPSPANKQQHDRPAAAPPAADAAPDHPFHEVLSQVSPASPRKAKRSPSPFDNSCAPRVGRPAGITLLVREVEIGDRIVCFEGDASSPNSTPLEVTWTDEKGEARKRYFTSLRDAAKALDLSATAISREFNGARRSQGSREATYMRYSFRKMTEVVMNQDGSIAVANEKRRASGAASGVSGVSAVSGSSSGGGGSDTKARRKPRDRHLAQPY